MQLSLVALAVVASLAVTSAADCQYKGYDANGNAVNYDLRPLVSPTTYIFRAKIGSFHYRYHGQQYDYLINVCDDVHPDAKHSACDELAHAPAYQVTAPPAPPVRSTTNSKYTPPPPPPFKPACFRLADSGLVDFAMLNETDPEEGVKVIYHGGQKCRKRNTPEVIKKTNETWTDIERQVELHLKCDRDMGQNAGAVMTDLINSGATVQVEEKPPPDECVYVIQWRTPHGCPYGSGYEKISVAEPAFVPGPGGGGGSWIGWLIQWSMILVVMLLVVVMILCLPQFKKRFAQYQRGDFMSMGEFVGYLMGDVQVRLQSLMGGTKGLPTSRQSLGGHLHDV